MAATWVSARRAGRDGWTNTSWSGQSDTREALLVGEARTGGKGVADIALRGADEILVALAGDDGQDVDLMHGRRIIHSVTIRIDRQPHPAPDLLPSRRPATSTQTAIGIRMSDSDVTQTMKYTHIGKNARAKTLANLPFQECHWSDLETTGGQQESSVGTAKGAMQGAKGTTNPGDCQGYVILCLPKTPVGVPKEKWRRQNTNRTFCSVIVHL